MTQVGLTAAELAVETGPLAGTRFLIDRPLLTIGRTEGNDIKLDDALVSKNHCRIIKQGDNFVIEDLASSNGTIVNGQQKNTHILQDGDRLVLGDTTLTFRKAIPAAAAVAPAASQTATGSSKKWIWITTGILAVALIIAAVVFVLLFVVLQQKDKVPPTVSIKSPSPNQVFEINMPVSAGKQITINVSASDDKGLDKVEILSGQQVLKTFKATTSRKESKVEGTRQEDFEMAWTTKQGDFNLVAKAYDWKGNTTESDPVPVKLQLGGDVNSAHSYCQQIDQLISEYSDYRQKFSNAYAEAPKGKITWDAAGSVFSTVANERRSLLTRLNSMTPPSQFATAHPQFKTMVQDALNSDEAAINWASAEYANQYYSQYGNYTPADTATYKSQVDYWSDQAQAAASTLSSEYNNQRKSQLDINDPAPNP